MLTLVLDRETAVATPQIDAERYACHQQLRGMAAFEPQPMNRQRQLLAGVAQRVPPTYSKSS